MITALLELRRLPKRRAAVRGLLLASLAWTAAVWAGDLGQALQLDLPGAPLSASLRSLAKQADLQISFLPEDVDGLTSSAVNGRMSARDALGSLLKGTNLTIIEQGADSVVVHRDTRTAPRPVQRSAPVQPPQSIGTTDRTQETLAEITVTSRKRTESVLDVPESVSAMSSQTLNDFKIQSFADYANKIPNLSYGYGGSGAYGMAGSRAVAIRGIVGAKTTGFYIDDTPVYDSMDPRIVDIDRIEVLKGPQGTLFGSRSLGGNVRIITKKPNVDADQFSDAAQISNTRNGGADYEVDGTANIVLVPERVALRSMAFYSSDSGFLKRTFNVPGSTVRGVANNQGATKTVGASVAALWKATDDLEVTLRVLFQRGASNGWPVAYAPLPAFEVTSLTLDRQVDAQEQTTNRFSIPSLEIAYRGHGWSLASSTSYSEYRTYDLEDGTEGIQQLYASFGVTVTPNVPITVGYTNTKNRFTHETRVLFDAGHGFSGVAGVYYADERSQLLQQPPYNAPGQAASGTWPDDLIYSSNIHNGERETAGFGELYQKFLDYYTLTVGARAFSLKETNNQVNAGLFSGIYPVQTFTAPINKEHGVVPKVALEYQPNGDTTIYASAAKGYRPGGIIPTLLPPYCASDLAALGRTLNDTAFQSDSIWSYEVGAKQALADRRVLLTGALYRINWTNIQQSIYLNCTFITTINVGTATSTGGEVEVSGHVLDSLELRAGLGYNDAKVASTFPGSPLPVGSRLVEVPKITASVGMRYERPIGSSATGFITGDYSYTGDSLSENTSVSFAVVRPAYSIANARIGVTWNKSELSLYGNNLTNSKANLGDPVLYTFRQTLTLPNGQTVLDPRVAVARPLQIGIRYQHAF